MKILITGNMGYIGPLVTQRLRSSYPEAVIEGFDIGYFGNCISDADILPECFLDRQHFGDMRNFPVSILDGVDAIVHLAGISNDPIGNLYEQVTYDINHLASIDLAKAAKNAGVKSFVFASSCSMYGEADDSPRNENSPLNPLTAYAKSKVYTERDLQPLSGDDFKVTNLRFSTACGMSPRLRLDLVLNDFVTCAITSKKITILSDGTPWRPLIDIKDMARAIDWGISREVENGGSFLSVNIGCDEWNYQVKDLAEAVAEIIPGVEISINPDAPPDNRSYKVNFNLFKTLAPGYQPQTNLTQSIKELESGLKAMNFTDAEFRESNYMRLKHLTYLRDRKKLGPELEWIK